MLKTGYVEGSLGSYAGIFATVGLTLERDPAKADVLFLGGGADISPKFYGQDLHVRTAPHYQRDKHCLDLYNMFEGKPIVGICRGAQFITAMQGGSLYQDVNNHLGTHQVVDRLSGKTLHVNSIHHQMMIPPKHGEILAHAEVATRKEWASKEDREPLVDTEAVAFWDEKMLAYQPHPELSEVGSPTFNLFIDYYKRVIGS